VSLFYPYGVIVSNRVKTATRPELFPSLVEIIWLGPGFAFDEAKSESWIINVFSPMTFSSAPFPPNYDMLSISPAPIENTLPSDCGVQITEPMHSSLSRKIREVYEHTQLDDEATELARRAVNDAIKFVEFSLPGGSPLVMLSDDGVLSIQWRHKNSGVM